MPKLIKGILTKRQVYNLYMHGYLSAKGKREVKERFFKKSKRR